MINVNFVLNFDSDGISISRWTITPDCRVMSGESRKTRLKPTSISTGEIDERLGGKRRETANRQFYDI